jgi:hypothetical protein
MAYQNIKTFITTVLVYYLLAHITWDIVFTPEPIRNAIFNHTFKVGIASLLSIFVL